jgi:hypothetical protein
MTRAGWGVVCLLLGCGPSVGPGSKKADQDRAAALVWSTVFRASGSPPEVRWVEGTNLTCADPNSGRPGFHTPNGCREGYTWRPSEVQVAWRDDDRFSSTTLAHEFLHALHFHLGIMDPLHKTPGFQPRSTCAAPPNPPADLCGIVEVANEALAAAQL